MNAALEFILDRSAVVWRFRWTACCGLDRVPPRLARLLVMPDTYSAWRGCTWTRAPG